MGHVLRWPHLLSGTSSVKGKLALTLSRELGVQYKTAFVLAHKLREAMAAELKGLRIGGKGAIVEVDGGYFGGYVKPANHKQNRRDRRPQANTTDGHDSYKRAIRSELGSHVKHRTSRYLNNRLEQDHWGIINPVRVNLNYAA